MPYLLDVASLIGDCGALEDIGTGRTLQVSTGSDALAVTVQLLDRLDRLDLDSCKFVDRSHRTSLGAQGCGSRGPSLCTSGISSKGRRSCSEKDSARLGPWAIDASSFGEFGAACRSRPVAATRFSRDARRSFHPWASGGRSQFSEGTKMLGVPSRWWRVHPTYRLRVPGSSLQAPAKHREDDGAADSQGTELGSLGALCHMHNRAPPSQSLFRQPKAHRIFNRLSSLNSLRRNWRTCPRMVLRSTPWHKVSASSSPRRPNGRGEGGKFGASNFAGSSELRLRDLSGLCIHADASLSSGPPVRQDPEGQEARGATGPQQKGFRQGKIP